MSFALLIVLADSAICYRAGGTAFVLLAGMPGGQWRKMVGATGVTELQESRGTANWPDVLISRRSNCFTVLRWDGRAYGSHCRERFGRSCR